MSLKKKAAQVRATGYKNSGQDSMLAHITPQEAALLKSRGGSGRRDPQTGLPHYDYGDGSFGGGDGGLGAAGGFGTGGNTGGQGEAGWGGFGGETGDSGWGAGESWGGGSGGGVSDLGTVIVNGQSLGPESSEGNGLGSMGWGNEMGVGQDIGQETNLGATPQSDIVDTLRKYTKNPVISTLMSLNPITKMANIGIQGPKGLGSLFGGLVGGLAAGPLGAMAGSHIGGTYGPSVLGKGEAIGTENTSVGGNPGGGINDGLLGGLAGLYLGNRSNRESNSQINNLNSLFGQDSPYAQAMRQQLERRDAAAGRRSQYGPREVELQAALATQASRMAPTLNQMYQQKQNNRNLMLSTLLNNPTAKRVINNGLSGIGSLFQNGGGQQMDTGNYMPEGDYIGGGI